MAEITREWCNSISEDALSEALCVVCTELKQKQTMSVQSMGDSQFVCLFQAHVAHLEAEMLDILFTASLCHEGMFMRGDKQVGYVCKPCWNAVRQQRFPVSSLANGLWIGNIPPELAALNFVEKLLVARYWHSVCIVKIGAKHEQRQYGGNAIVFSQPVAKFYHALPPPKEDLDECLAVMLTRNIQAADIDFSRTPLLVRKEVVLQALTWLKKHNRYYQDLEISYNNLNSYRSNEIPVAVLRRDTDGNVMSESPAVYDHDDHRAGTSDGRCTFAMSVLTGHEIEDLTVNEKIMCALSHLRNGEKVAQYWHADQPESIYHNPALFPGLFPWLFPYRFGGFKNAEMRKCFDQKLHVRHLLFYHDRRFQTDEYFAYLVYNQEQI